MPHEGYLYMTQDAFRMPMIQALYLTHPGQRGSVWMLYLAAFRDNYITVGAFELTQLHFLL